MLFRSIPSQNPKGPILQSSFVFQAYHPLITIMNKNYVAPNMPVEELPEEYHYLRDLTEKEANDTGLAGCAIYVNPQDEDMSEIYLYQECGTPIDEHTVDNTQRQWAYVQWSVVE